MRLSNLTFTANLMTAIIAVLSFSCGKDNSNNSQGGSLDNDAFKDSLDAGLEDSFATCGDDVSSQPEFSKSSSYLTVDGEKKSFCQVLQDSDRSVAVLFLQDPDCDDCDAQLADAYSAYLAEDWRSGATFAVVHLGDEIEVPEENEVKVKNHWQSNGQRLSRRLAALAGGGFEAGLIAFNKELQTVTALDSAIESAIPDIATLFDSKELTELKQENFIENPQELGWSGTQFKGSASFDLIPVN